MNSSSVKKSVIIDSDVEKVWEKISKIEKLDWLEGQKSTKFLGEKKSGVGAKRLISFEDGSDVEEHIVGWKPKEYFSYIAISGLPLDAYHATISIEKNDQKSVKITWESYFASKLAMNEFEEFVVFLSNFYTQSLKNLKKEF
ncbi:MAG: SRPBCC family protein [Crenarchaeota archaeon]|nr:SRPBCC family protein [Thermoproteota archaeon]MDA1124692.1 SRPBCC family protein [Thermoproteota archaeon]